jgi:hypothetical protein
VDAADALVADDAADQRDHDGRGGSDDGAVGHARSRQPRDEQVLIERLADDAERRKPQQLAPRHHVGRVEDALGIARAAAAAPPHDQHHHGEHRRRDDHPDRIERLRIHLAERVLDDRVVRAPDDGHQEQEEIDRGEAWKTHERERGRDTGPALEGPRYGFGTNGFTKNRMSEISST